MFCGLDLAHFQARTHAELFEQVQELSKFDDLFGLPVPSHSEYVSLFYKEQQGIATTDRTITGTVATNFNTMKTCQEEKKSIDFFGIRTASDQTLV